jgi:hypothetical protein
MIPAYPPANPAQPTRAGPVRVGDSRVQVSHRRVAHRNYPGAGRSAPNTGRRSTGCPPELVWRGSASPAYRSASPTRQADSSSVRVGRARLSGDASPSPRFPFPPSSFPHSPSALRVSASLREPIRAAGFTTPGYSAQLPEFMSSRFSAACPVRISVHQRASAVSHPPSVTPRSLRLRARHAPPPQPGSFPSPADLPEPTEPAQ